MKLCFYQCKICGKIITVLSDTETPTVCCGETMQKLTPNMTDGAYEKHLPVLSQNGNTVCVEIGSIPHPMTKEHSINWVCLQTDDGFTVKQLEIGDEPKVCFEVCPKDCIKNVFAYCNLHGLWCLEVKQCGCGEKTNCN